MKEPITRLDYCQYLLVSQINYTLTNFADHSEKFSHDSINRYLREERLTPRLVWDNIEGQIIRTAKGYVIFDDTVAVFQAGIIFLARAYFKLINKNFLDFSLLTLRPPDSLFQKEVGVALHPGRAHDCQDLHKRRLRV